MGIVGALGLFISIIFHELRHSLVAKGFGILMKGITLFIFGGIAEMGDESPRPKAEFIMAIAGPISNIILGFLFYIILGLGKIDGWSNTIVGVTAYLFMINFLLAAFNLLPAFPLDGGRVFRSLLWGWKGDLRWATKLSSRIGVGFGIFLIVMGFFHVLIGDFISGMWWFLIGIFLQSAAKGSYQQLLTRGALEGEPVRRFMEQNPVTVSPSLSVEQLVDDYIYRYHYKMFPVVEGDKLIGCITTKQVKDIPREEWIRKTVGKIAVRCLPENTIGPEEDAMKAISIMNQSGASRLMVIENGRLVGIIALKDMLKFLSLKVELEE
ncbi:MAG: site-2 protease family protein [Thermodesulfobacteriota bacterium]|nr:site-2 protease family protein [Thermodesulfobacteriota bacterium]